MYSKVCDVVKLRTQKEIDELNDTFTKEELELIKKYEKLGKNWGYDKDMTPLKVFEHMMNKAFTLDYSSNMPNLILLKEKDMRDYLYVKSHVTENSAISETWRRLLISKEEKARLIVKEIEAIKYYYLNTVRHSLISGRDVALDLEELLRAVNDILSKSEEEKGDN